ncbi:tRNA-dependent cyclodipeptide synthase [Actinomadura logoneensis]|uniref:Cyclodipeptide synthase n=1 Tax=Actinomadura logoneensis TaxID=2293572 RepID=A0A372JB85_9ACTN|nr:tRNA-dependent cyclodipeptide synthase [Actinomadura logoneensis]RFU37230.1 tRNA-dependent cyclodipeptide synthase [Actinomadura logoneensis]
MQETAARTVAAPFTMAPYTENCARLCERAEHLLLRVGPETGPLGRERLSALLRWAGTAFDRVDVIVADVSLVHVHQALGQPPEKARKNANHRAAKAFRRVSRAWEEAGVPPQRQRVHLLSTFLDHPVYARLRAEAQRAVAEDPALREVSLQAARKVLRTYLKDREPDFAQVDEGKNHLIAEMPWCLDTPGILGVPSSVTLHPQRQPLAELMFASPHLTVSPRQGQAVVRPRFAAAPSS